MKINDNKPILKPTGFKGKGEGKNVDPLAVSDRVIISSDSPEVTFYSKADFPGETSHLSKGLHSQSFKDITNLLNQAVRNNQKIDSDLGWVDMDIRDAENDLRFSHSDINQVKRDTDKTDVSQVGYRLDNTVRDVQRELRHADTYMNYATGDVNTTGSSIASAGKILDKLERELAAAGGFEAVLGLITKAKQDLSSSSQQTQTLGHDIYNTDRDMESADREMQWSQTNVDRIKWDRPGTNVSSEGYHLDSRVNQAEWKLRDADRNLSYADSSISSLDNKLGQLIRTVQNAENLYNSISVRGLEGDRLNIETAKTLVSEAINDLDGAKPELVSGEGKAIKARETLDTMEPHIKKIKLDFIGRDVSEEGKETRKIGQDASGYMVQGEANGTEAHKDLTSSLKGIGGALENLEKLAKEEGDRASVAQAKWELGMAKQLLEMHTKYVGLGAKSFKSGQEKITEMGDYLDIVEMDTVETNVGYLGEDIKGLKGDAVEKMIDAQVSVSDKSLADIRGYLEKALKNLS